MINPLDILRRYGILADVKRHGETALLRRLISDKRFDEETRALALAIQCITGERASHEAIAQFAFYVSSRCALTPTDVVEIVHSRLSRTGSLDSAVRALRDLATP